MHQFVKEGHLCWDSLDEHCALVPTLDEAIGQYLEGARYPSQKVNEIDNRGSTYCPALARAKALAAHDGNGDLMYASENRSSDAYRIVKFTSP